MRTILVLAALFFAMSAAGATIRVERDGSGDYTVIQAAVDAAVSGDTIRIGPGRYNDGANWTTPGWTDFVRVVVRQPELALIGAGPELTIIGPTTSGDLSQGGDTGIDAGPYWGNQRIWVSGIGFENMGFGIRGVDAPEFAAISNCRFLLNAHPILFAFGGVLDVRNCSFELVHHSNRQLGALGMDSVLISDCQFDLALNETWPQEAVHLESVSAAAVAGCVFHGGYIGLGIYGVQAMDISRSVFSDQTAVNEQYARGLNVVGSALNMVDCAFDTQVNAVFASEYSSIEMTRTHFADASVASLNFETLNALTVHQCVLARGTQYSIWQRFPCDSKVRGADLPHLDMRDNDWGTSSADSIASWIRTCQYVVDYIPFIGQPVAVENKSWGELKALFR